MSLRTEFAITNLPNKYHANFVGELPLTEARRYMTHVGSKERYRS
jgi:hypothetical protein